jgi:hypothetical protein
MDNEEQQPTVGQEQVCTPDEIPTMMEQDDDFTIRTARKESK